MNRIVTRRSLALVAVVLVLSSLLVASPLTHAPVRADHTPSPTSVTIAGDLQIELGCAGDWQPECASTHLAEAGNGVWRANSRSRPGIGSTRPL